MRQPAKVYPNYYPADGFFYIVELIDDRGQVILARRVIAFDREQAAEASGQVLGEYLAEECESDEN